MLSSSEYPWCALSAVVGRTASWRCAIASPEPAGTCPLRSLWTWSANTVSSLGPELLTVWSTLVSTRHTACEVPCAGGPPGIGADLGHSGRYGATFTTQTSRFPWER